MKGAGLLAQAHYTGADSPWLVKIAGRHRLQYGVAGERNIYGEPRVRKRLWAVLALPGFMIELEACTQRQAPRPVGDRDPGHRVAVSVPFN